jgi:hypothetical protein
MCEMILNNQSFFYGTFLDPIDMTERKYRYHTVNLPPVLVKKIVETINSGKHGFNNVPDFVKAAVRKYLRDLGYLN